MTHKLMRQAFRLLRMTLKKCADVITCEWLWTRRLRAMHLCVEVERPSSVLRVVRGRFVVQGWAVDVSRWKTVPVRVRVSGKAMTALADWRPEIVARFANGDLQQVPVGFTLPLLISPGLRRVSVEVQAADGRWLPVQRTLIVSMAAKRARTRSISGTSDYGAWQAKENDALAEDVREEIRRHLATMTVRPSFSIIVDLSRGQGGLGNTLRSLKAQVYEPLEITVVGGTNGSKLGAEAEAAGARMLPNAAALDIRGSHCVFVDAGATLHTHALYEFASIVNASPAVDVIYADEDVVDAGGRHSDPFFKPEWSPDYLEVFNYIEFPTCFRSSAVKAAYGTGCLYDLALRVTESATEVIHIPKVLGHRPQPRARPVDAAADAAALQARLERTGRSGVVTQHGGHQGCHVVMPCLVREPKVSVIIPTAGRSVDAYGRHIDLVENVVDQIRNRSSYRNLEIVVVESGSLTDRQRRILQEHDCHTINDSGSDVNIARKINRGAREAGGEYLVLLNDDIEILTSAWIERLVRHFAIPDVGVVGCRLLYQDGTIQHAGVVFVEGRPEHVRWRMAGDEAGYFFSTCAVRNYLAVTGACMMTPRDMFHEIGGYDETFPLNYNDIDYCLKARRHGRRVIYDGGVALTHLESVSRPAVNEETSMSLFARRWAADIVADPFYNDRVFNLRSPAFVPQLNPRQV